MTHRITVHQHYSLFFTLFTQKAGLGAISAPGPALFPISNFSLLIPKAIPHNSKCRYGERGAADAKPKAQIILDAAKVSAASGGNSEPKQGQRSQSARGFCPRSTMRVPQPDIIEHFGNADAVPQLPERCLSRKAGIMRCCPNYSLLIINAFPLFFPFRAKNLYKFRGRNLE